MRNPVRTMLRTHRDRCMVLDPKVRQDRTCTCGRDKALELYEDIESFLIRMSEWLEDGDSRIESNSHAHKELDELIKRLA